MRSYLSEQQRTVRTNSALIDVNNIRKPFSKTVRLVSYYSSIWFVLPRVTLAHDVCKESTYSTLLYKVRFEYGWPWSFLCTSSSKKQYNLVHTRYVCMYGSTLSKSMDQPGKVANAARGHLINACVFSFRLFWTSSSFGYISRSLTWEGHSTFFLRCMPYFSRGGSIRSFPSSKFVYDDCGQLRMTPNTCLYHPYKGSSRPWNADVNILSAVRMYV
jgi:hypothetical protein